MPTLEGLVGELPHHDLHPAHGSLVAQLFFDGGAVSEARRHELTNFSGLGLEPIEPRLSGSHDEILLAVTQALFELVARDRAAKSGADLDGDGDVRMERQPHGLALIDGHDHSAAFDHVDRGPISEGVHTA